MFNTAWPSNNQRPAAERLDRRGQLAAGAVCGAAAGLLGFAVLAAPVWLEAVPAAALLGAGTLALAAAGLAFRHALGRPLDWLHGTVIVFFVWGAVYPVLRIEILSRTGLPSEVAGLWQDLLAVGLVLFIGLARPKAALYRDPLVWAVAALLGVGAVTGIVSASPVPAVYAARLSYLPIVFFFAGRTLAAGGVTLDRQQAHGAILAVATVGLGFFFSYVIPDYWKGLFLDDARGWGLYAIARVEGLRMTGAMLDPVAFGTVSAWGAILCLNLVFRPRSGWRTWAAVAGVAICVAGSVLSLTRGAWVALAVGMAVTMALSRRRWLYLGLLIVVALLVVSPLLSGRVRNIPIVAEGLRVVTRTWDKTLREGNLQRDTSWNDTLTAVLRQPIGYGLGQVGHIGERFRDWQSHAPTITDGWYLKLLAEGGPGLLAAFLAVQAAVIWRLGRLLLRRPKDPGRDFRVAALSIVLAALVQAIASNLWDLFFLSQSLWLITGLATFAPGEPPARPASSQGGYERAG